MKNKYISKNIRNRFFKSTAKIKSVLFLFLGVFVFVQTSAQTACPPDPLTYTSVNATDITTSDGEITITVSSAASGPFDYYLYDISATIVQGPFTSQVSNVFTFLSLSSGYYQVAVNNQECLGVNGFNILDSVMVYPSDSGSITYSGFMGYCGSAGANITAFSNGCSSPTAPFSNNFELFDLAGLPIWDTLTLADSAALPALVAGDYVLEILNTENNCFATDTFTINSNVIQSTYTYTNPSSAVATDGSITITSNGTSPFQISIDNGSSFNPWNNGDSIPNLSQGTYICLILDASGCMSTDIIELIYNACSASLDTIGTCYPLMLSAQTTNVISGVYAYTYNLYFEGTLIDTINNSALDSISFNTMVSDSGQYVLEVINDSTGCISSDSINIVMNPITVNATVNNITNLSVCNGSIFVTLMGGQFPYTFNWDTAGVPLDSNIGINTNQILLCENTYCLTIIDANGCTYSDCYDVAFISCNTTLAVTDSIDCFGGIGEITATIDTAGGGAGAIPVLPNERYTYTLYSTNPQVQIGLPILTDDTSNVWAGLFTGYYLVDVIDNSYGISCTSDSLFLSEPEPIVIYTSVDSSSAPWIQDGVITIDSITGGTPGYNITWLDSVGIPLPTFGNLVQDSLGYSNQYNGGYTINVTDTNGCFETVTVYVHPQNAGDSLSFDTISVVQPTCFGSCDGKLWAHVYGIGPFAVPPFIFEWYSVDPPTGNQTLIRIDSLGSPWYSPSHIATHTNLCEGVYILKSFDFYGNAFPDTEFVDPIEFPYGVKDPDSLYVQLSPDFVIPCGEDTVLSIVTLVGGTSLTNDTLLISTQTLNFNNAPIGFSENLTVNKDYLMVVSGTYVEIATGNTFDAAYEYTTIPATPTVPMNWVMDGNTTHRPSPDVYQATHSYNFPFVGAGTHTFSILAPGFTGNLTFQLYEITLDTSIYTYSWITSPPSFPVAVISTADTAWAYPGVSGTDYILTVEDANGCEAKDTVNVSWDLYILNFESIGVSNAICNGGSTGSIIVIPDITTGFTPYTILMDGSATTIPTPLLPAGSYTINIEDSVGCLSQDSVVIITQPDSLYACGIDTVMVPILVDAFTMTFDTAYSYTTVLTQLNLQYKLVISGTYFDEWNNNPPVDTKDAAYQFNDSVNANPLSPPLAINEWGWNGVSTARPTPDVYDPTTHTYEYYFVGDSANQVFTYTDPTGNYLNNGGSLSFELYKMLCSTTDTAYTCFGDSTATATVYPNGGVPFINNVGTSYYNVVWTDNLGSIWGTSATVYGLPTGNFTVTITDSLGCTYQRGLVVLESAAALQIDSLAQTNVMCKGDSTGIIYAVVSGGFTSNYVMLLQGIDTIFSLSGQLDTIQITGLPAGIYEFFVFDSIPDGLYGIYGCGQNVQITITEPQDYLSSTINLLTNVSCWGDSTGAAVANVIGGQFPYTYAWDNGETTSTADSLWAGWQGITFTDANGCTLRDSIEIIHLYPQITGVVTVLQNNSCFNACDAIATLSTIGGVLPHSYWWDVQSAPTPANMPDTVSGLCAGGHDILVEDALGCRQTITFMVTEPDELFAQAIMTQPVQCFGFDDGTAFGTATGGTPTYSFVWDSINGQAGQNAVALTPGIHILYVTDDNGCTASDTVVITEPTQLQIEIIDTMTVYSYCAGTNSGQLCAIATGGTPNYNYVWNDMLGQTTSCAINLIANQYTVIVMDDRNCIASASFNLDSITNTMITDSVDMTIVDVSCFGDYNGSVTINSVGGAVAPFTYNWTPAVGTATAISSLYAGSYAVVIEDSNGCALTVNAEVGEPDQVEYTIYNVIDETCFGACDGQMWVNVEGGTGNYYYDNSELGIFPIPGANQVQLVNDSLIYDLCSGLHSIYITDDNNCEGAVVWGGVWQEFIDSGVVVIAPLVVNTSASCANSYDGAAWIPWPGGNPLFTYTWETFPITTTIDTGVSTSILFPGDYVLVAHYSDSASFGQVYSGCDASSVVFTIGSPAPIISGAVATDVLCYGDDNGSIDLTPAGGVSPYLVSWDITTSIPGSTIQDHNNLLPGTYTVTITDASGCEITDAIVVGEPDAITSYFNVTSVSCNGLNDGSATVVATGGITGYGYSWSPSGGNTATASSLSVGVYTVEITDANGCIHSNTVSILEPASVISSVEADPLYLGPFDVRCFGESNASATAYGSAVSFSWEDAAANVVATIQSTGPILSAGTYIVTASDANGCTGQSTIVITEPNELLANITWSAYSTAPYEVSCFGANDGWAESNPNGGVGGINTLDYNFVWKDNLNNIESFTPLADDLTANKSYTVTVTDANGCQALSTTPVFTEPVAFIADVTTTNYAGPTHAPFTVNFVDNTVCIDPYDFNWTWEDGTNYYASGTSSMDHEFIVNNVGLNNVYVILTNQVTGCTDTVLFIIEAQGFPSGEIFNVFSPNNDGTNDNFTFGEYGMEKIDVKIFNRWGQEVYSWTGENKAWDGRGVDGQDLPEGVYFFVFKADGIDGHYYEEKGSVTLLR